MKKIVVFLLLLTTVLLSSCAADQSMDPMMDNPEESVTVDTLLVYRFDKGTFNSFSTDHYLNHLKNYKLEFFLMYNIALESNYTSYELTQDELNSFNQFFDKIHDLIYLNEEIFTMDSTSLLTLVNEQNIELNAFDLFTFNRIKEIMSEFRYLEISITVEQLIKLFSTDEDIYSGVTLIMGISQELNDNALLKYEYSNLINRYETVTGNILTDNQKLLIQDSFQFLVETK